VHYPYAFFQRWFPGEPCPSTGLHDALAQHVPETGTILDVGCGKNELLSRYRTPEREVWGADFAAHAELQHSE